MSRSTLEDPTCIVWEAHGVQDEGGGSTVEASKDKNSVLGEVAEDEASFKEDLPETSTTFEAAATFEAVEAAVGVDPTFEAEVEWEWEEVVVEGFRVSLRDFEALEAKIKSTMKSRLINRKTKTKNNLMASIKKLDMNKNKGGGRCLGVEDVAEASTTLQNMNLEPPQLKPRPPPLQGPSILPHQPPGPSRITCLNTLTTFRPK